MNINRPKNHSIQVENQAGQITLEKITVGTFLLYADIFFQLNSRRVLEYWVDLWIRNAYLKSATGFFWISPLKRMCCRFLTPLTIQKKSKRPVQPQPWLVSLTLIPTAVTIYGSNYFKAKFLKKSLNNKNLRKIANP
jgi:hypothetical protein